MKIEMISPPIHPKLDLLSKIPQILFTFVLTVFSIIYNGYVFGKNDHTLQVPLAKFSANSSYYSRDLLIEQVGYISIFWEFVAMMSNFISIPLSVFLLYVFLIWLYFHVIYTLGTTISHNRFGGIFLSLLLLTPKPGIAYSILTHDNWLSLRVVVLPLLILSLHYAIKGEDQKSFILLGLTFNLHPISAVQIAIMLGFNLIIKLRTSFVLHRIVEILKAMALFVVFALPNIILILQIRFIHNSGDSSNIFTSEAWLTIMRMRSSNIVFPFSYTFYALLNIPIYIILIYYTKDAMESPSKKILYNWLLSIALMSFINLFFSEIIPVVFLIQLQFGRSLRYLPIISLLFVSNYLTRLPAEEALRLRSALILVASFLMFWSTFYIVALGFLGLLVIIFRFMKLFEKDFAFNLKTIKIRKLKNLSLLILLMLIAIVPHFAGFKVQEDKFNPTYEIVPNRNDPWIDVQIWVKTNTNIDSLILTPPHLQGFRVNSERAIFGEWKDGTLAYFNETFAFEWWDRMQILGYNEENFNSYGEEQYRQVNFASVSLAFDIDFVIVPEGFLPTGYSLDRISYSNDDFQVMLNT